MRIGLPEFCEISHNVGKFRGIVILLLDDHNRDELIREDKVGDSQLIAYHELSILVREKCLIVRHNLLDPLQGEGGLLRLLGKSSESRTHDHEEVTLRLKISKVVEDANVLVNKCPGDQVPRVQRGPLSFIAEILSNGARLGKHKVAILQ